MIDADEVVGICRCRHRVAAHDLRCVLADLRDQICSDPPQHDRVEHVHTDGNQALQRDRQGQHKDFLVKMRILLKQFHMVYEQLLYGK